MWDKSEFGFRFESSTMYSRLKSRCLEEVESDDLIAEIHK